MAQKQDKWRRKYTGPYLIVDVLGPVNVKIQKSARTASFVVHTDKVKLFEADVMPKSWLSDNNEPLDDGPEISESSTPEAVDDSAVQAAPDTSVAPDWPPPVRLKSPRPKRDIKLPKRLRD